MRNGTVTVRPSGFNTPLFSTRMADLWTGDSLPFIRFNLQAFTPLWDLRQDYLVTGNPRDLARGRELVRSWLNAAKNTSFMTDDVTVAWRATALAAFVDAAAEGEADPAFQQQAATLLWDAATLLAAARQYAADRVVCKRPADAPPLGRPPEFSIKTRKYRFDVYLRRGAPRS